MDNKDKRLISEEEFVSLLLIGKSKIDIFQEYQLSMDCLRDHANTFIKHDWEQISAEQCLTEDFMREFHDKIDWVCISDWQVLSEDFIREFENEIFWDFLFETQKLSNEFVREFKDRLKAEYDKDFF
jgi:hypothetical protein